MLQSPILDKIGGSPTVRDELTQALAQGRSVTATVRWIAKPGEQGRNRWIAFTPLVGSHTQIGVWIAILVDDELENEERARQAPPVKYRAPPANRVTAPRKPASSAPEQSSIATERDRISDMSWEKAAIVPDKPVPPPKDMTPSLHPAADTESSSTTLIPKVDEVYETLEERLRKKRQRDAARLLEQPGVPVKPTYKSLSPYVFMNNDGP